MIKKKNIYITLIVLLFIILGLSLKPTYSYNNNNNNSLVEKQISNKVITTKEIVLYSLENEKYNVLGKIGEKVELELEDSTNKYYKIKESDNYYILYQDVKSIDKISEYDNRYKNYIVFNKNVNTKKTNLYDEDNNLVYSINKEMSLPIIIMDTDRYGVEYNNRLLYIKKEEGTIIDNHNTDKHNSSGVGVLNYHFFYHKDDKEETKKCQEVICVSDEQFKTHLDYFNENNILTLKMKEVEMYVDGKIRLPKSVLITIDDGATNKAGIELLTDYKMYGTIFLITGWFDASTYYKTEYIELHSHGDLLHDGGKCPGGQGGAIKCLDKDLLQKDLKKSREDLNGSTYFAYPFYEYNDYAIENLKEAGFTMAFIGESSRGDNLVHVGDNKFLLHRFVIVNYTTMNDLNRYFGGIK